MKRIELILEDGSSYQGFSFGAKRSTSGEVVFNTGMVGYCETLTDPSYRGQILVFTYPLVGNYGVPKEEMEFGVLKNFESSRIHVSALVVSDYSFSPSHWNAAKSLSDWLKEQNVPGMYGVDTRALTKKLREKGTMLGKVIFEEEVDFFDPNVEKMVELVSTGEPIIYNTGRNTKIIVIDCGLKFNILRSLLKRGCTVIRVPFDYDFFDLSFDAVVVSNGPGNPKMCPEVIERLKKCFEEGIPTFGICLGNQLMALAAGAKTYKLKYGHRSQNQPCLELGTKRCFITSQNHGYAVEARTLPSDWEPWFVNANDGTNEGIRHIRKPFWAVQFHPEHSPGPRDTEFLFDLFLGEIRK